MLFRTRTRNKENCTCLLAHAEDKIDVAGLLERDELLGVLADQVVDHWVNVDQVIICPAVSPRFHDAVYMWEEAHAHITN